MTLRDSFGGFQRRPQIDVDIIIVEWGSVHSCTISPCQTPDAITSWITCLCGRDCKGSRIVHSLLGFWMSSRQEGHSYFMKDRCRLRFREPIHIIRTSESATNGACGALPCYVLAWKTSTVRDDFKSPLGCSSMHSLPALQ